MYYILDGKRIIEEPRIEAYAEWFETANRTVEKTTISDDVEVSTVFLGLDHRFVGDGPPILFETLVFGGKYDGLMVRYTTWAAAEFGHEEVRKKVGLSFVQSLPK